MTFADIFGMVLLYRESLACGGAGVNIFNYRAGLDRLRDTPTGGSTVSTDLLDPKIEIVVVFLP